MILTNYTNKFQKRRLYIIAGATIMLLFPLYIYLFSFENIELEQSFCPIKMSTGLPCPGCGITKSIVFMYDGNFTKSFYYHLFGPFAFAFLVGIIILFSIEIFTKKSFSKSIFFNLKIAYFLAITLSIYHIIRLIYFLSENNFSQILKESIWY